MRRKTQTNRPARTCGKLHQFPNPKRPGKQNLRIHQSILLKITLEGPQVFLTKFYACLFSKIHSPISSKKAAIKKKMKHCQFRRFTQTTYLQQVSFIKTQHFYYAIRLDESCKEKHKKLSNLTEKHFVTILLLFVIPLPKTCHTLFCRWSYDKPK